MQGFFKEHLRPLAGSAGLHLALVGVLALAALRWTSQQPPVELAIQGYVVDGPVKVRPLPEPRQAPAEQAPPPVEAAKPPEPVVEPPEDRRAEEAAAAERAAEQQREQQLVQERAAQAREVQVAREKASAEQRRAEEAERKRAEEAAAKRKAAEDAERKKVEASEARRKADEKAQAEREAKVRAEREADLQRRLAAEEEEGAAAVARAGVMDEYRLMLVQTIERNWNPPPSARAGLECTLYVTQAPGGVVTDVKLGACNGDQAVRESITTAVYKSSPLPAPRDPRAFERRLEIVFRPTE
jgi:colicin import membrane protein